MESSAAIPFSRRWSDPGLNDCRYWYVLAFEGERLVAHCGALAISFYLDIFGVRSGWKAEAAASSAPPSLS